MQTFLILGLYILLADYLPLPLNQLFYTISLFLKDVLLWSMPLVVCFFIAHALQTFERRAPLFVLILLLFEGTSNLSAVWYAFFSAHTIADALPALKSMSLDSNFNALWRLPFSRPAWWSADKGALVGLVLGGVGAFSVNRPLKNFINQGKEAMLWALTRLFARLIPFYVLGFIVQLHQTKTLSHILNYYGVIVVWLFVFLLLYLLFLFMLGAGGISKRMFDNIKALLPAGGLAFSSGCSLSTMPWTIEGTEKTLDKPELARVLIPATTNIQQVGDCITNAFLCFLIYKNFFGTVPDVITWVKFSFFFVLARYITAGFQGGAIFIMLPIYEAYLDFNAEMIALILALNVVLDPLVTSSNVLANGALARTYERIWERAQRLVQKVQESRAET